MEDKSVIKALFCKISKVTNRNGGYVGIKFKFYIAVILNGYFYFYILRKINAEIGIYRFQIILFHHLCGFIGIRCVRFVFTERLGKYLHLCHNYFFFRRGLITCNKRFKVVVVLFCNLFKRKAAL